jgi:hypothetical protein
VEGGGGRNREFIRIKKENIFFKNKKVILYKSME